MVNTLGLRLSKELIDIYKFNRLTSSISGDTKPTNPTQKDCFDNRVSHRLSSCSPARFDKL